MNITINGKEYGLRFGIGFIKELDDKYSEKGVGGARYGVGLEVCVPKMLAGRYEGLYDILYAGIDGKKPNTKDMENFIDECEDLEKLVDEVVAELKKSNVCKLRMKNEFFTREKEKKG